MIKSATAVKARIKNKAGDEITLRAIAYKLPLIVEDRSIDLRAYNLETLLASMG